MSLAIKSSDLDPFADALAATACLTSNPKAEVFHGEGGAALLLKDGLGKAILIEPHRFGDEAGGRFAWIEPYLFFASAPAMDEASPPLARAMARILCLVTIAAAVASQTADMDPEATEIVSFPPLDLAALPLAERAALAALSLDQAALLDPDTTWAADQPGSHPYAGMGWTPLDATLARPTAPGLAFAAFWLRARFGLLTTPDDGTAWPLAAPLLSFAEDADLDAHSRYPEGPDAAFAHALEAFKAARPQIETAKAELHRLAAEAALR